MKTFKTLTLSLLMAFSGLKSYAHDEGHGPKLNDSGKYGGLVGPVVDMKDKSKGAKADLVYKAELVRSSDGTVRVYFYDKAMKPLDLKALDGSAKGILAAKVNGKYEDTSFDLKADGKAFVGKAPKIPSKPYNLDFHFKEGTTRELLTAFDDLD